MVFRVRDGPGFFGTLQSAPANFGRSAFFHCFFIFDLVSSSATGINPEL